jgi:hypothetical protein
MQHLNHDMDELMRRAAESYPVKPQGADWEKVAQQLEEAETKAPPGSTYGVLKKLLLLLPFILASFVCDKFFTVKRGTLQTLETAAIWPVSGTTTSNEPRPIQVKELTSIKTTRPIEIAGEPQDIKTGKMESTEENTVVSFNKQPTKKSNLNSLPFAAANNLALDFMVVGNNSTEVDLQKVQHVTLPIKEQQESLKKNPSKKQDAKIEKVYVSLLMGPDFSRVKSQKVNPAGYSIGFVAGYNFSRRWGVESGLFWDKKNYYSDGEYFKTDKIYLPHNSTVIMVDGYCAMFEIPLNIRYRFVQNSRNVLAASVGVSSYLMQDEDYDYVYRRYGEDYAGNAKYNRASQDWFSIANVSLGYEHKLGIQTKIRVEPYMKLPLKGVGIGSLPLHSTGLLIGITRTIQ